MAVICEMSCGRGRAEDCRPPPLCGAVISPPEHKTTRVNPSIRINSVQRVNSAHVEDCPDGVCGRGVVRAHGHGGELQLGEADPLEGTFQVEVT